MQTLHLTSLDVHAMSLQRLLFLSVLYLEASEMKGLSRNLKSVLTDAMAIAVKTNDRVYTLVLVMELTLMVTLLDKPPILPTVPRRESRDVELELAAMTSGQIQTKPIT
ncbi:Talin Rod Domain-Containing Protein 1 [Manis pentadactyla]|nr:Talin Rod Domain-Containing Protein 1 [Manis pentadactyla]